MTDGSTGIQVAPTEDEMNSVHDILKRAISAVVGMSQLQADVDMLRSTVSGLQADADRLRNHNESLDEALHQSRMTRNDLTTKLAQVEMDLRNVYVERDDARAQRDIANAKVDNLAFDLNTTKLERDDGLIHVMELEDELKAANAKLDAAKALFAPEPVKPTEPLAPAAHEAPKVWEDPEPEPVVVEPINPIPLRRYLDQWSPGAIWDPEKNAYYV